MIVREMADGRVIALGQEDHADVAAQCAAHWGNERFDRLRPYETMVFATIYHDSHHRELEAQVPVNQAAGRPSAFRERGSRVDPKGPITRNVDWIRERNPYAAVVVSMHQSGLAQGRYGTVSNGQRGAAALAPREVPPDRKLLVDELEAIQRRDMQELRLTEQAANRELWFNYRMLQVFDLLSLHLCCDGYDHDQLKGETIGPLPVSYDSDETVDLQLIPMGGNVLHVSPYPFDVSPLTISVTGKAMQAKPGGSEDAIREAFYGACRTMLTWELVK